MSAKGADPPTSEWQTRQLRTNTRLNRAFKLGYYFDLYSSSLTHWQNEARFNTSLGPEFLEIMLEYPGSTYDFDASSAGALRDLVPATPFTVHAPTINLSLVSLNRAIRAATQRELVYALEATGLLGADLMTIHGGEYPYYACINDTTPAVLFNRGVRLILDHASWRGITVCVENLKGSNIYPVTFTDIDAVLEPNPGLMLSLDVRHFCISEIDPIEAIVRYRSRIRSVHYRADCGLDQAELRCLLGTLMAGDYDGYFIIEDRALNMLDKDDKSQLAAGVTAVKRGLTDLGAV
jgi:sugar phosphate isomerase/epimerase